MVVTVVPIAVVIPVVVVMVLMRPVAFVLVPAVGIVVPMGMDIVGAGIGRLLPVSRVPAITAVIGIVVAFRPDIARTRDRRPSFIAQRRRRVADGDAKAHLCRSRSSQTQGD